MAETQLIESVMDLTIKSHLQMQIAHRIQHLPRHLHPTTQCTLQGSSNLVLLSHLSPSQDHCLNHQESGFEPVGRLLTRTACNQHHFHQV